MYLRVCTKGRHVYPDSLRYRFQNIQKYILVSKECTSIYFFSLTVSLKQHGIHHFVLGDADQEFVLQGKRQMSSFVLALFTFYTKITFEMIVGQ